ncbi:hypothetical protein [Gelria sp. Kuro-4]|uniref:portal protein n=1 Tax=Gelria sp. Kuro-4 TaxID=2796927 RepID=UPI001BED9854|nr:hypothetical protein [Gelria sp. Kuro-4]BCV23295.1 hypothetical protein kuro4_00680 [Gelria sp. Kuro-4]
MPQLEELINRRYQAAKTARRLVDKNIKLNIAFFQGDQWTTYDATSGRVVPWMAAKGKPRATTNLIMPVVRIEYAKLTRNDPSFKVTSTTADLDDVSKAKACKQFLDYKWETDRYANTFKRALLWALVSGTSFVKVYFDPGAGPTLNGEALGDVVLDYCSPLEMFVDPFARTLDEASWVIHARVRSTEYVAAKYGVKVPPEQVESLAVIGLTGESQRMTTEGTIPATIVKEYWERPSPLVPQGRYVVMASNKLLYEGPNPYIDIAPIPFAMMVHIPVPGRLFGESVITSLRQVNTIYNKLKSDIIENTSKLSNPPMFAPVGALLKPPEFSPGEVIYFNPTVPGKIDQAKFDPYPPQVVNTLMRLLQERDDISGINDVSRGIVPRGIRSGEGLSYLLEQDETRLAVTARNYEAMIGDAMGMVLRMAREFYDIPRVIRILGTNNQREVALFKAEDIPPDADVRVEAGSTLPKSMVQQQQFLLDLWDRRIINDPRLVLRLTQYGSTEEVFNEIELDSSQALRENDRMAAGVYAEVEDFHNHAVHIAEHNRFRKTVDFERLAPERRELFKQHVDKHKQFLAEAQQGGGALNGAGQEGQASGGPGGPGGGILGGAGGLAGFAA